MDARFWQQTQSAFQELRGCLRKVSALIATLEGSYPHLCPRRSEAFDLIKKALSPSICSKRITYRARQGGVTVTLDDRYKPAICRLMLRDRERLTLDFLDGENEQEVILDSPKEVLNYSGRILVRAKKIAALGLLMLLLPIWFFGDSLHTDKEFRGIKGGEEVFIGQYPSVVWVHGCTGTLIAPTWVLTAAHCLTQRLGGLVWTTQPKFSPDGIRIERGWTYPKRGDFEQRHSAQFFIHPDYQVHPVIGPIANDAALIQINQPFTKEPLRYAQFYDLSEEGEKVFTGQMGWVVGWGRDTANGEKIKPKNDSIQAAQVTIYRREDCGEGYAKAGFICTIDGQTGTNPGDSGGPLFVQGEEGSLVQIGITKGNSGERYLFMRTAVIYDWIFSTTGIRKSQVLTHVFAGSLSNSTAETEIVITNPTKEDCRATIQFHQGTRQTSAIRFNGKYLDENILATAIKANSVHRIILSADRGKTLVVGAVYITTLANCHPNALQVEGRYLVTSRNGQIVEAFSVQPQAKQDWLSNGDCRLLSSSFGSRENVGLAMVASRPGEAAPQGTELTFEAFDWDGNSLGNLEPLTVTGSQHALNPWKFGEPRLLRICLSTPPNSSFRLSLIAIGAKVTPRSVQYFSQELIRP